jgi:hypothetical protein
MDIHAKTSMDVLDIHGLSTGSMDVDVPLGSMDVDVTNIHGYPYSAITGNMCPKCFRSPALA